MAFRNLGQTGLAVSSISLGTINFGLQVDEPTAVSLVRSAVESGINFFDTADVYAGNRAEEVLGKALAGIRQSIVLATKVGQRGGIVDVNLSRKYVISSIEASLRRLQTDYVDVYYAHQPDYNTPIEETLRTFDDLIHQGKVRYIACSNYRAYQLALSLGVSTQRNLARFICIQSPYNLIGRDIEYELLPLCESERVGVTVYSPLAGGLLSGKYDLTNPPEQGRFTLGRLGSVYRERYWRENYFQAVGRLKTIAEKNGRTLPQFALAWTLQKNVITSAVISASSVSQLKENVSAADIKLSPEELKACDEVWEHLCPSRFLYGR